MKEKTVAEKMKDYNPKFLSIIELGDLLQINEDKEFIANMDALKDKNPTKYLEKLRKYQQQIEEETPKKLQPQPNIPKCPICGSTNIKKISGTKRWVGTGLFGLASSDLGKTMQCNNCGAKW